MAGSHFSFRGFMAPVFTPFHDDEEKSLNLRIISDYSDYLSRNNIYGVLVNGTSGEATSQTLEEREKVAEAWIKAAKKTGQTVMVQVGGTNLKHVQRLASHAEQIGASAILCLADLFHKPSTADKLVDYLKLIAKHARRTPLLYYHLPEYTGININMEDFLRKANEIPNFVGVKFTSTDLDAGARCLTVGDGKFVVFLGSDTMLLPAFSMGFDSVIGTTLNMMAGENLTIYHATKRGDLRQALTSQRRLTSAIDAITKHGTWVETMKSAMNLMTPIKVGPVREPLSPIPEEMLPQLREELKAIEISF